MVASILVFLLVLSVLVLVHELGHFLMAKRFGIWVEEFGFGLPPRVLGKKIGETIYSLNLFPFGGFVRLHGENSEGEITHPARAYLTKGKKVKMAVVTAGVVMNLLLGVLAFSLVYSFSGIPKDSQQVRVVEVVAGSPAQQAGIIAGDIVRTVAKTEVTSTAEFITLVEAKKGARVEIGVKRVTPSGESLKKLSLIPRVNPPENEGALGVVITTSEIYWPPIWQRPFVGVYYGVQEAFFWGKTVVNGFVQIFRDLFSGITPKDVAGPIGIFAATTEAAKYGILAVVNFVGILSINLAILNIFPFPALDGGRLLFLGLEKVLGRKVLPKVEAAIHTIGMAILLILLLGITLHDVKNLIAAGGISGFLKAMVK